MIYTYFFEIAILTASYTHRILPTYIIFELSPAQHTEMLHRGTGYKWANFTQALQSSIR